MPSTPAELVSEDEALRLARALSLARPDGFTEAEFTALYERYTLHKIRAGMVELAMSGELGMSVDATGEIVFGGKPTRKPSRAK